VRESFVLPEFSLSPYFPQKSAADWGANEPHPEGIPVGESCKLFSELARDNSVFLIGSLYERGGLGFRKQKGVRFNTAVAYDPLGNLGGACRAQHVRAGTLGEHDSEYFAPGNSDYPVFAVPDVNLAMPTGYDHWFPESARILALKGAELIAYPVANESTATDSATPDASTTVLRSHAIANGVFVAASNRVGTEGDQTFSGGSVIIAPNGGVLAQGSCDQEEVVSADLDPERIDRWRSRFPFLLRREPETYSTILGRLTLNMSEPLTEAES
jgi:N-carbamoylputrescine amidase